MKNIIITKTKTHPITISIITQVFNPPESSDSSSLSLEFFTLTSKAYFSSPHKSTIFNPYVLNSLGLFISKLKIFSSISHCRVKLFFIHLIFLSSFKILILSSGSVTK